ncbi:PE domain-containing protein [Gordonia sp. HNM0687]|uniref:PE domain-containing protein n=1 Tax=Gordonia mangrovi TaxID=2665643 RepID=A0A6L7GL00_9ACTN|nr:PE family protein [Gordonia mangrovi]MXP20566.1 PE domain-containing protein [Gordonia mangrovi]UVF78844.1 PE family protein [Gordonia mangrovi]
MADPQLNVDPTELITAAGRLDRLAERLETSLASAVPALSVPAAGRDEVSQVSAASFTSVAETFASDSAKGVEELRKIAAVLRAQADGYARGEDDAAAGFRI